MTFEWVFLARFFGLQSGFSEMPVFFLWYEFWVFWITKIWRTWFLHVIFYILDRGCLESSHWVVQINSFLKPIQIGSFLKAHLEQCFWNFLCRDTPNQNQKFRDTPISLEKEILTVWKWKFWQFENVNFDSLEKEILTVWKWKFWQFENGNFDSLKIGNFDQKSPSKTRWKIQYQFKHIFRINSSYNYD